MLERPFVPVSKGNSQQPARRSWSRASRRRDYGKLECFEMPDGPRRRRSGAGRRRSSDATAIISRQFTLLDQQRLAGRAGRRAAHPDRRLDHLRAADLRASRRASSCPRSALRRRGHVRRRAGARPRRSTDASTRCSPASRRRPRRRRRRATATTHRRPTPATARRPPSTTAPAGDHDAAVADRAPGPATSADVPAAGQQLDDRRPRRATRPTSQAGADVRRPGPGLAEPAARRRPPRADHDGRRPRRPRRASPERRTPEPCREPGLVGPAGDCYYLRSVNSPAGPPAGTPELRSAAMAVQGIDLGKYKLGWHDTEQLRLQAQEGPERGGRPRDLVAQVRAGVDDEVPAQRAEALRAQADARVVREEHADIDFDDIYYYMKPTEGQVTDWDMLPEEMKTTYEKLGIPEAERKFLAGVTAQYESRSRVPQEPRRPRGARASSSPTWTRRSATTRRSCRSTSAR